MRPAAAEHAGEQLLEIPVYLLEHSCQPLPSFAVQMTDGAAQLGDGRRQFVPLGDDGGDLFFDLIRLQLGAQIHRPHLLALLQQALLLAAGFFFGIGGKLRRRVGQRCIGAQPFQDTFGDRAPGVIGLGGVALGAHQILARGGQGGVGGAGGAGGGGPGIGRGAQRLRGAAVDGFGLGQRIQCRALAGGDGGRGRGEFGMLGPGGFSASGKVGDAGDGVGGAFGPSGALPLDRLAAGDAGGMFARQAIMGAAGGIFHAAGAGQRGTGLIHTGAQGGNVRQAGLGNAGARQNRIGIIAFRGQAGDLLFDRLHPCGDRGGLAVQRPGGGAGKLDRLLGIAPCGSSGLFGGGGGGGGGIRPGAGEAGGFGLGLGFRQPSGQAIQPVALL